VEDHDPAWFLGDCLPLLRRADAVIANLESPITTSTQPWRRTFKFFHFKAPPQAVDILAAANTRIVCLANNHMLDYGEQGLLDTIASLDRAGIRWVGAGRDAAEAARGRVIDIAGRKVGFIGATDGMPEFAATTASAGTHVLEFRGDNLSWIERSVSDLRRAGAVLIVLTAHWGPNMRRRPSAAFRVFAHQAIAAGVDVIHGHSAHVTQAVERIGSGIVLYDTGNFIDDYWRIPFRRTRWSFVWLLEWNESGLGRLKLVPVVTRPRPVRLATGRLRGAIADHIRALCAKLGTPVQASEDGLVI
jgi:poly-gamma-glutamate synthesis protein (capsule biosynthesis protein)